MESKKTEM